MKILIADDSPSNLAVLSAGLELDGHEVLEAANGIEAIAVLEREFVDAVITDLLMPGMDGFRLCHQIRQSARDYRGVPVILYTATYDSPSDHTLAETVGADGYILKPAPVAVLIEAIRQAMTTPTRSRRKSDAGDEPYVMERYDAVLVNKLEARNEQVQRSLESLQVAHKHIQQLNELLEARVAQRTAALDSANKELEAFSFSVSHDLRAPLHRITGFAQLLQDSALQKLSIEESEFLTHVVGGATQLEHLIETLLQFARASRTEMRFGEVDLELTLDQAIELLKPEAVDRQIEWRRAPLPKVRGDETLLRQVLVNLVSNAIKYTRGRAPAIIEIGSRQGPEHEWVIFVRDNGAGFDMRYAEKLFGVFQRMHRTEEFEGTGIGLANARRIVTRHGGSIWAEAKVGLGATLYFSLPWF